MTDLLNDLFFIFQRVDLLDVVDLILVTAIFFLLLSLVRGTQAVVLLRGMILLIIGITLLTSLLELPAFSFLLSTALPALVVAIPVIFAPEIRRALERIGRAGTILVANTEPGEIESRIDAIVTAAQRLTDHYHGALIVIEREVQLQEYIETGVPLDATLSAELLLQIFYTNTPLHDGAVIVREDRITAASCVLPLSASGTLSHSPDRQMGLRHRAALGISEVSDAVAIVVSEERGVVSVAHNGRMIRRLDGSRLRNILIAFYRPQTPRLLPEWLEGLLGRFGRFSAQVSGRG